MGKEERERERERNAVFWYSRRDSLEGIRVLFFAEKRNFAYLAGCRQGLDVNRLISVHELEGREARARNYLFASGFTRAPKARSHSRRGPSLENLPRITKRLYSRRAPSSSVSRFLFFFFFSHMENESLFWEKRFGKRSASLKWH